MAFINQADLIVIAFRRVYQQLLKPILIIAIRLLPRGSQFFLRFDVFLAQSPVSPQADTLPYRLNLLQLLLLVVIMQIFLLKIVLLIASIDALARGDIGRWVL